MRKIDESHVFTGMQRDLSVSKHPIQFLYDARNIRLTAREGGDTLLSITNEKSTAAVMNSDDPETALQIVTSGDHYLGHCLLNQYLVVFSTDSNQDPPCDYIERIDLSASPISVVTLYSGENHPLNFNVNYPIEAIPSYETENIQKVYWTDGLNQPRVINIVAQNDYTPTSFDFVRELQLKETVSVKKILGASGMFAPGVIQYAFTYYDKYSQETCVFHTTPLYYISYPDRGASPEDKVENAFEITVSNVDRNFEFLRIYSIQRTSINGTPIVKRVQDIETGSAYTRYADESEVEQYISSDVPLAKVNGVYITASGVDTHFSDVDINGHTYKTFHKSYLPDLLIKADGYTLTWGLDSTSGSIIYISVDRVTVVIDNVSYTGFHIIGAASPYVPGQSIVSQKIIKRNASYGSISYIDTGFSGNTIDPTELLYKGGEVICAGTLCQKDNTLFLGDIHNLRTSIRGIKDDLRSAITVTQDAVRTFTPNSISSSAYIYANQLTSTSGSGDAIKTVPCAGFKHGETYRLGFQLQYKTGQWSEPVLIENPDNDGINQDFTVLGSPSLSNSNININVPVFKGNLRKAEVITAYNAGYRRIRAVVVYPEIQDRTVLCQGVINPTLFTENHRYPYSASSPSRPQGIGDLQAQSDWFFRGYNWGDVADDCSVSPVSTGTLQYTNKVIDNTYDAGNIRKVEIQGDYKDDNKFVIRTDIVTMHSPDIEFDDRFALYHFDNCGCEQVGYSEFKKTLSDINIQTETPTVSNSGNGFVHRSFIKDDTHGIVSGLFYDDFCIEDWAGDGNHEHNSLSVLETQNSSVKWMVYLWNKSGSLNNDINRPSDRGTATSILKKKKISNLRFAEFKALTGSAPSVSFINGLKPKFFSSNEDFILKFNDSANSIYKGNIDTVIVPDNQDGMYFAFENTTSGISTLNVETDFTSTTWWKTFATSRTKGESGFTGDPGLYFRSTNDWQRQNTGADYNMGNQYIDLVLKKDPVRMKYKSTPHLVFGCNGITWNVNNCLPIVEITQPNVINRFGGNSADALKENTWIPCGEPVYLDTTQNNGINFDWEWGDTYYQRYDCLKTYAYTPEDINQVVEIGSFMLETHVNIDGRYDRNRGQSNNLNMSPVNFNLINPVYSQLNNFFSYKILDDDFYSNVDFPNQITWTKEKQSGADVDNWTNITLASTYDMDGSKGKVEEITTWKDQIYCFQHKGVSNILFNSRVQIPASDGVPIEISNSYKVDGYRYISDGIGCDNKQLLMDTPQGIYFIDSIGSHLFHIGEGGITDITAKNNMSTVFKNEEGKWKKLLYDNINHDLYLVQSGDANEKDTLCYSETLGQFTSFMDYHNIKLIETYGGHVFTMKLYNGQYSLWKLFEGDGYNNFFGTNYPWGFTFISNGINDGIVGLDKTFTNLEFRANVAGDGTSTLDGTTHEATAFVPTVPLDYLETWDEYQHGYAKLENKNGHAAMQHHIQDTSLTASLKRKFRIWRCDIPRNNCELDANRPTPDTLPYSTDASLGISRYNKKPNDRMRNPWLYLKVQKNKADGVNVLPRTEVHDIMVSYFV